MDRKILMTGDYSHPDFRRIITGRDSITMVPLKRVFDLESEFDLVVIAQAYPDQFDPADIENIQRQFPATPIVAILGSWCEGESRTGKPWPGVIRIYWHQWTGRYEQFLNQLAIDGFTSWHEPKTSTVADRILRTDLTHQVLQTHQRTAGISATTALQFEMLKDAFLAIGLQSIWIELSFNHSSSPFALDLICIDANHLNEELESRIAWLRQLYASTPIIVVANFPRVNEVEHLISLRVSQVVSKPFELADLEFAIRKAKI